MRIKDSPKSNAEGGTKKEGKKKVSKQKTENIGSVTKKNEKPAIKIEKEEPKQSPPKDEPPAKVVPECTLGIKENLLLIHKNQKLKMVVLRLIVM